MEKQFKITDPAGIHARPASILVQGISMFQSTIELTYRNRTVNLKSIMGVMSLGIPNGSIIVVRAKGTDEKEALDKIEELMIHEKLGELVK